MAVLKVFARKTDQPAILEKSKLIEDYEAFVVVEAAPAAARALEQSFPMEDITDQYRIALAGREIDPLAKPSRVAAAAAPEEGAHHYIVQFIGPIKPAWLTAVRRAGATVRQAHGGFAYVVRATPAVLDKLRA